MTKFLEVGLRDLIFWSIVWLKSNDAGKDNHRYQKYKISRVLLCPEYCTVKHVHAISTDPYSNYPYETLPLSSYRLVLLLLPPYLISERWPPHRDASPILDQSESFTLVALSANERARSSHPEIIFGETKKDLDAGRSVHYDFQEVVRERREGATIRFVAN